MLKKISILFSLIFFIIFLYLFIYKFNIISLFWSYVLIEIQSLQKGFHINLSKSIRDIQNKGILASLSLISISFFSRIGFVIIPIATTISTWIGVLIYMLLLNQKKSLLLNNFLLKNFIKILVSTVIMSFILLFTLESFASYLEYSFKYKAVYLISIVGFVGILYLLSCYLLGILKLKNYKAY